MPPTDQINDAIVTKCINRCNAEKISWSEYRSKILGGKKRNGQISKVRSVLLVHLVVRKQRRMGGGRRRTARDRGSSTGRRSTILEVVTMWGCCRTRRSVWMRTRWRERLTAHRTSALRERWGHFARRVRHEERRVAASDGQCGGRKQPALNEFLSERRKLGSYVTLMVHMAPMRRVCEKFTWPIQMLAAQQTLRLAVYNWTANS